MFKNKVQRYSIRKLTVGAASVLIGMAFLNSNEAKADTVKNSDLDQQANAVETSDKNAATTSSKDLDKIVVQANNDHKASVFEDNKVQVAEEKEAKDAPKLAQDLNKEAANNANQTVAKPAEQAKDSTKDPKEDTHKVTIKYINDYTGKSVYKLNRETNKYEYITDFSGEFKDGEQVQITHEVKQKDGSSYQASTRPFIYNDLPGFKLLNYDEISQAFPKTTQFGDPIMSGDKDIELTLHYAPLSDTYIRYVDENGKTIAHTVFSNQLLTPESQARKNGDKNAPVASRYEAAAINIPGYELVSDPIVEGQIADDAYKTKDNPNPTIITFKYKKVTPNADSIIMSNNKSGDTYLDPKDQAQDKSDDKNSDGIALSTTSWSALPGMFSTTRKDDVNMAVTTDGRDVEQASADLIKKYQTQGFTYAGTSGKIIDKDPYNYNYDGTNIHLIHNMPVLVDYVDEDGKSLAPQDVLQENKNNPDQTNNGINEKTYWYPEGQWSSKPKDIKGYDLVKTLGSENGKYTLFTYRVTYVYAKHVKGGIKYIDDTNKKVLKNDGFNGKVGDKIDYTTADKINDFKKHGYELVSNNFNDNNESFKNDGNMFEVHLTHALENKNTSKTITRVVNYVDENGKPVASTITETITLTGQAQLDKVTNKTGNYTWNEGNFKKVNTPEVPNYHVTGVTTDGNVYYTVDQKTGNVSETPVTHENGDTVVTVHFAKNPQPEQPTTPVSPTKPTEPAKPTTPVSPTKPTEPAKPTTPVSPTKPTEPAKPTTPVSPTKPTEPAKPTIPVNPTTPVSPSNPTNPTSPTTPVIPEVPDENVTPHPETPVTPENPTSPSEPVEDENVTPHGQDVPGEPDTPDVPEVKNEKDPSPANNENVQPKANKVVETATKNLDSQNSANELPQTGEGKDDALAGLGLAFVSGIALIGLTGAKKRKN